MNRYRNAIPMDEAHIDALNAFLGPVENRYEVQRKYRLDGEGLADVASELEGQLNRLSLPMGARPGVIVHGCLESLPSPTKRYPKRAEWFTAVRRTRGGWSLVSVSIGYAPSPDESRLKVVVPDSAVNHSWVQKVARDKGIRLTLASDSAMGVAA